MQRYKPARFLFFFFFFFFFFFHSSAFKKLDRDKWICLTRSSSRVTFASEYPVLIKCTLTYLSVIDSEIHLKNEPPHDKTNNVVLRPVKTQISLGTRPVWSESSLSAWKILGSLATHWAHSEYSDRTGHPGWFSSSLGAHSFCWFCHEAAQMTVLLYLFLRFRNTSSNNFHSLNLSILYMTTFFK